MALRPRLVFGVLGATLIQLAVVLAAAPAAPGASGVDVPPVRAAAAWNAPNIVDRLESGGLTWKAYMEDMPSNCYARDSGQYAVRHNPFVYYNDIATNASRCARVVPSGNAAGALLNDLASTTTASNYLWFTPNDCNNMHSYRESIGDT